MEWLFYAAFVLSSLYVCFIVLLFLKDTIWGRESAKRSAFRDIDIALFVFVPLAAVISILVAYIGVIPDGKYEIYVGMRTGRDQLETRVPADLTVSSDVEYEERESSAGGWDHTRTIEHHSKYFWIDALYVGERAERNKLRVEIEIEPGHTGSVWIGDTEAEITLDNISAATLGVSLKDCWDRRSASSKFWTLLAPACSILGLYQCFVLDESRRRAKRRMS